jgi:hypothetical protein
MYNNLVRLRLGWDNRFPKLAKFRPIWSHCQHPPSAFHYLVCCPSLIFGGVTATTRPLTSTPGSKLSAEMGP